MPELNGNNQVKIGRYVSQNGRDASMGFGGCLAFRYDGRQNAPLLLIKCLKTGLRSNARFNKGGRLEDEFIRDRHYITFRKAARGPAR